MFVCNISFGHIIKDNQHILNKQISFTHCGGHKIELNNMYLYEKSRALKINKLLMQRNVRQKCNKSF